MFEILCQCRINPYKPPIVLFVGHVQTVETQIRRSRTLRLISVSTVCLQNFLFKLDLKRKLPPNTHKLLYRFVLPIEIGKLIRLKWVKHDNQLLPKLSRKGLTKARAYKYIQMFRVNVIFISSNEAQDVYFMSGEAAVSSKGLDEFAQRRDDDESSDQYLELYLYYNVSMCVY